MGGAYSCPPCGFYNDALFYYVNANTPQLAAGMKRIENNDFLPLLTKYRAACCTVFC